MRVRERELPRGEQGGGRGSNRFQIRAAESVLSDLSGRVYVSLSLSHSDALAPATASLDIIMAKIPSCMRWGLLTAMFP